jgi:translation elongation factor EF-G
VYGHESADPLSVAQAFSGTYSQEVHSQSDLAIFVINPATGIDQNTIDMWQGFDEFQVPRMVVVTQLEKSEADFDDAVMLANRVFDQVITPYLVLHDDQGLPVALISLADLRIIDYSTNPPKEIDCSYSESHSLFNIANMINNLDTHKVHITFNQNEMGEKYCGNSNILLNYIGLEEGIKQVYNKLKK